MVNGLEILTLSSFAIAQPLFDMLKRNPDFLVAHHLNTWEITCLAVGLAVVAPAICVVVEGIVRLLGKNIQLAVHTLNLAGLGALILLPFLKRWNGFSGYGAVITAFLLGLAGSALYVKSRTRRFSFIFLSPAVILFPLLFLFRPPISRLVFTKDNPEFAQSRQIGRPVPIIMVVFDEFPLTSLLNEKLEINSFCYPHFARLSNCATWYRNATAVSEGTLNAVPSILDGLYPQPALRLLPNANDHPHTLFTLLGRNYEFHVLENDSQLCPESLCGGDKVRPSFKYRMWRVTSDLGILYLYRILPANLAAVLPDITQSWKDFAVQSGQAQRSTLLLDDYTNSRDWIDRPEDFKQFVDLISASAKPTLHFLHSILPHAPWEYLPSGKKYTLDTEIRGVRGINSQGLDPDLWGDDRWAVVQAFQRHLLQVQLVDNLLGYLIAHLKSMGLYDQSLIVVTADHGCSFRPNDSRRSPTATNYADILAVPLFIKLPYQRVGSIDDRNIEAVDILPTIADVLKIDFPWKVDGTSALTRVAPPKARKTFIDEKGHRFVFEASLESRLEAVNEKIKLFGSGDQPDQLFRVGAYGQLVGRKLTELDMTGEAPATIELDHGQYLGNVDFRSQFLPAHISGHILRPAKRSIGPLHLAVAINGTIQGVTETYWREGGEFFSVVVPESGFQEGENEVRIFSVEDREGHLGMAEFPRPDRSPRYQWGTPISFAKGGNYTAYETEGWGVPDGQLTWTNGKRASLMLPVQPPGASVTLKAVLIGYVVPGAVNRQRVRILVNRQLAGEWEIRSRDKHMESLLIPNTLLTDLRYTVITFETPDAVSPARLGLSKDVRELAVAFFRIEFSSQPGKNG